MDYKEINDYELLYMISDNDDSFEMLLEKYRPFINQKLSKYIVQTKKYGIDLDDLKQEIYLAVIDAVRNYDIDSNACFYTYLNVLVERRIANFWREYFSSRHSTSVGSISLSTPINDNLTVGDIIADESAIVEDIAAERDLMEEIYNFCYDLSLDDAYIFEMFLNGYSREFISYTMGLSYKRVAYLLDRIKIKLKNYLLQKDLLVI